MTDLISVVSDLFNQHPAVSPFAVGLGAAAGSPPSPAAAPSLAPWWAWLRAIVGVHPSVDEQVEAMCRYSFAGWDGVAMSTGPRLPGLSDVDKAFWRAHYRAAAEAMIEDRP